MSAGRQPRSWLYVPGHQPSRLAKALTSGADALVIDLEDAVPPQEKESARLNAANFLSSIKPIPIFVRINSVDTPEAQLDIAAITAPGLSGVRVPKVESADQARQVVAWLNEMNSPADVHCLLESALAVELAYVIATANPRVTGIGLGEADLGTDLGVTGDDGLMWSRSRVVVAARAAGLAPPVQSVSIAIDDDDELRTSCEVGKMLGFFGRSAIHPRQLQVINEVYTPTDDEIAAARQVVRAWSAAQGEQRGACVMPDGRFVDRAVAASAQRVLALGTSDQQEMT